MKNNNAEEEASLASFFLYFTSNDPSRFQIMCSELSGCVISEVQIYELAGKTAIFVESINP